MFRLRNSFSKHSKLPKCMCEYKLRRSVFLLGGNFNYAKNYFYGPTEINGFHKTFTMKQKVLEIRSLEKYMSNISEMTCWSCKQHLKLNEFYCSVCGALQYPDKNLNFFELLGITQEYEISIEELTRKFRSMQMKFHPDKFTNKSKEELEISESYSRLLNKAYTTLKDPVSRGFYLLELENISKEPGVKLNQEFLAEVMETNEELETVQSLQILRKYFDCNNKLINNELFLINDSFRSNNLQEAKIHLLKLNYYMNLRNKIQEKQSSLVLKNL